MADIIAFAPRVKPDLKRLTIVFDDVAIFCSTAAKHLRPNLGSVSHEVVKISSDLTFIAFSETCLALHNQSQDQMLALAQRIADRSDALLNLLNPHCRQADIVHIAQTVFSQAPAHTPNAPLLPLHEKAAILRSFGANRLAALLI